MGKPVVATPIEELHDWPGVLLASTPEKFATELDQALSIGGLIGNPEDVERLLQQSTWPEVVRPLMDKLNIPKHEPN